MYEPIINPMIFYWIELADKIQLAPLFAVITGFLWALCFFGADLSIEEAYKTRRVSIAVFIVLFAISIFLALLVPSKDTMYKMLIAKQVTPHNLQVTGETVDKAIDKVAEKIIRVAKEIQK